MIQKLLYLYTCRVWGVIRASIPIIAEVSICRGKLCLPRQNNQAGASAAPITGPRRLPRQTSAKPSCQYSNCRGSCAGSLGLEAGAGTLAAAAHAHMRMRTPCNIHVYCMLELSARCTALCVHLAKSHCACA